MINYSVFVLFRNPCVHFYSSTFSSVPHTRHDRTRNWKNWAGQSERFEAVIQPHWKAWVSMCHDLRADRITVWQHPLAESRSSLNSRHSCPVCSNLQLNAEGFFFTPHDCPEHQNGLWYLGRLGGLTLVYVPHERRNCTRDRILVTKCSFISTETCNRVFFFCCFIL